MKKTMLLLALISLVFGSCEMVEDVLGTNDADQGTTDTGTTGTGSPASIPVIPGTPSISPGGAGELVLQWSDNSDNESGFKIERSAVSESSGFSLVHTPGANTSSLIDTGLAEETRYWYRICSYNSAGNSDYSAVVSGVIIKGMVVNPRPAAPSGLFGAYSELVQLGIYKVMMEWTDNSSNETSFIIERSSTSASTGFTQIGTKSQNIITYTDNSVSRAQQYWYRVCASNSGVNSAYSNVLEIYTGN